MVEWPKHGQTIRDDELLLFAYCRHRWGDAAYADRSDLQYEDVATRLNDQFRHRFGEYTACAVRRYLQRLRSDARYRWPETSRKRYYEFSGEITAYLRSNARVLGPGMAPPPPVRISDKGQLSVRDVVARLKALEDGERVTLLAEFADAFGPLLTRTLRARKPKYEAELMNRLLTAAVAIFGSEQHTMDVLRRTRFFSKTSKPQRRAVNTAARQRCRDRLRAVFQATAAIRFFISGMNKSQWERDRLLRSKEMNTAEAARYIEDLYTGYIYRTPSIANAHALAARTAAAVKIEPKSELAPAPSSGTMTARAPPSANTTDDEENWVLTVDDDDSSDADY